jgi:tripartite-type tricarboxylate transporter receptor subunit TctC
MSRTSTTFIAVAAIAAAATAVPAQADSVADFYRGKTITIVVSTGPGGGYDLYSRTLSMYFGKHIPGHPNFVLTFMPGAGGMKAGQYLYNVGAHNSLMIGNLSNGLPLMQKLRTDVRFDVSKFNYIGRVASQNAMTMVNANAPATTLEKARTTELTFGGTGKAQQAEMHPNSLRNVLGFTKIRIISGYKGSADVILAMEKGEVDGQCTAWSSWKTQYARLLKEKKVVPLVEHGVVKSPDNPGVPLVLELARNDFERKVLTLINSDSAVGRNFALPPGVPADHVAALRAAFMATMKDKDFLADAHKRNMDVLPMSGEALQKLVVDVTTAPPNVVQAARKALLF